MEIERKDAQIFSVDMNGDAPHGSFTAVLSAPTLDRDGDTLLADGWKQPLPDRITMDVDHQMSVAGTVGSAHPYIDADGSLKVDGIFASTPLAQEVRTLVNEGHITTLSVAFLSEKSTKDGATRVQRELLNGAFVAIPSNREAIVLSSKSGARNSKSDAAHIQSIHDASQSLGATCSETAAKSSRRPELKAIAGSIEALRERVTDALQDANTGTYVWSRGIVPDGNGGGYVVFELDDMDEPSSGEMFKQAFTDDGAVVTLVGDPTPVDLQEVVKPDPDPDNESAVAPTAAAKAAAGSAAADEDAEMQFRAAQFRAYTYLLAPERG